MKFKERIPTLTFACIYTYTYTHIHTFMHICAHTDSGAEFQTPFSYTYTYTGIHLFILFHIALVQSFTMVSYIHTNMHICLHIYICIYRKHQHTQTHLRIRVHNRLAYSSCNRRILICIYSGYRIYIYTYMYTYTFSQYMYTFLYTYIYTQVYTHMYGIFSCGHGRHRNCKKVEFPHSYSHAYTSAHTHAHIPTHVHMHTYIQRSGISNSEFQHIYMYMHTLIFRLIHIAPFRRITTHALLHTSTYAYTHASRYKFAHPLTYTLYLHVHVHRRLTYMSFRSDRLYTYTKSI